MKFLVPTTTVILMSHMKPYLREALESVCNQTRKDIQVLVVDSGRWMGQTDARSLAMEQIYKDYVNHPLIEWIFTGESPTLYKEVCMVSYMTNKVFDAGLVRGKYFCTFYDDDIYYPTFIERMSTYLDENPQSMAVRCTENRTQIMPGGSHVPTPPLVARNIVQGQNFDCSVDGMQVMMRTHLWKQLKEKYPDGVMGEDLQNCSHSDGVFFNKLATIIPHMDYIEEVLCEHRATPISTYTPTVPKRED